MPYFKFAHDRSTAECAKLVLILCGQFCQRLKWRWYFHHSCQGYQVAHVHRHGDDSSKPCEAQDTGTGSRYFAQILTYKLYKMLLSLLLSSP